MGKRQGNAVLYLEVVEGIHVIRYNARVGDFKPLHSSSIGKAMLGSLSKEALQTWLKTAQLTSMTPKTITAKTQLVRDLDQGRERGYLPHTGRKRRRRFRRRRALAIERRSLRTRGGRTEQSIPAARRRDQREPARHQRRIAEAVPMRSTQRIRNG